MTEEGLTIQEVRDKQDLMAFVRFPWEIYRNDRYWVPPLIKDQLQKFSPDHPFRSHSEMILFMAKEGKKTLGGSRGSSTTITLNFTRRMQGSSGFLNR